MAKSANSGNAAVSDRFLVVPGLIVTTFIATGLFATRFDHWTTGSGFASFVVHNRSAISIVVQVISHVFGMVEVYALCTTINLSARLWYSQNAFRLDTVKFLNAVSSNRFDASLPGLYLTSLVTFMLAALLPGALWAGAITPVVTSKPMMQELQLAAYTNTSMLDGMPYHSHTSPEVDTNKGLFTFQPEFDMQGQILSQAAAATNRTTGAPSSHAKLDRTNYLYMSRNYGVGASVGLTDDNFHPSTNTYSYIESGFLAETSCIYNSSANIYMGSNVAPDTWTFQVFEVLGSLPIGGGIDFSAANFGPEGVVALQIATEGYQHVLGIASASNPDATSMPYSSLYNVQCDMTFKATNFSVAVDKKAQTITVDPLNTTNPWPVYGNTSVNGSVAAIGKMSYSLCTALYTQILGQTLLNNVNNAQAAYNATLGHDKAALHGVADAVTSWLDNFLLAYSSAQIMVANVTEPLMVETSVAAVTFGTPTYIFPIFALNLVICITCLAEMVRTRAWSRAPRFNFLDIKSVIVATSIGGTNVAQRVCAQHEEHGTTWHAAEDDRFAGETQVRLDQESRGNVAIVLASDGQAKSATAANRSKWPSLSSWHRSRQGKKRSHYQYQSDLQVHFDGQRLPKHLQPSITNVDDDYFELTNIPVGSSSIETSSGPSYLGARTTHQAPFSP